jgi:hypothetical protein
MVSVCLDGWGALVAEEGVGRVTAAEKALVYQALREAASVTRVAVRRQAYLDLAKKMKEERDAVSGDNSGNNRPVVGDLRNGDSHVKR